jgi:hypothetical protein
MNIPASGERCCRLFREELVRDSQHGRSDQHDEQRRQDEEHHRHCEQGGQARRLLLGPDDALVLTIDRTLGRPTRSARLISAWLRSGRNSISTTVSANSSAISGALLRNSSETRRKVASRLRPASVQVTIRSRESGS